MSFSQTPYSTSLKRSSQEAGLDDEPDDTRASSGGLKSARTAADADIDKETNSGIGLESLPIELLTKIAFYLSTSELLSLRLTSRIIEVKLFNDFARYYFAKKQFMLTAESLQCLVDISLHPKLSTVLEHVIISLDRYVLTRNLTADKFKGQDTDSRRARYETYLKGYYDQFAFLTTGGDRQSLTEAFRNLKNLKTVGLRDYNNNKRSRDGPDAVWRAYGAGTVLRETEVSLLSTPTGIFYPRPAICAGSGTPADFSARAFVTLLAALGESGASPENFEILLRSQDNLLPDHAFHFPPWLKPTVSSALPGLRSLLLTAEFIAGDDGFTRTFASFGDSAISKFLYLVPNLVHLRLNSSGKHHFITSFLIGLADTDVNSPVPLLPRLERLDFGMFALFGHTAGLDPLSRVVARFGRTLKALGLWKLSVQDSQEQQDAMRRNKELRPQRWAKLLANLPRLAPGLERLTVGALTQVSLGREMGISIVSGARTPHGHFVTSRTYRPEDMRDHASFKALLEKELAVPWWRLEGDGYGEDEEDDEDGSDEEIEEAEEEDEEEDTEENGNGDDAS